MRTANYTELRGNMKSYLDNVIRDNEPLVVHRQGAESVVILSLSDYNAIRETEFLMRSPAMMEAIRQGERDIAEGRYVAQQEGESIKDFLQRCIK